ncbi:MAG: hypothetical protein HY884_02960 [Deltaproteobacteria bacterium]|nr:hypothetical protein [Deltaproteobacteria bacterium]
MKTVLKFFIGMCIGAAAILVLLYFGGAKYVTAFGRGTEGVGRRLEKLERPVQEKAQEVKKTAGKTIEKTKDAVKKAAD